MLTTRIAQQGARRFAPNIYQHARNRYHEQLQMQRRLVAQSQGPARGQAQMVFQQMRQSFRPIAALGWPSIDRTQLQGEEQELATNLLETPGAGATSFWERLCSWLGLSPKVDEAPAMETTQEGGSSDSSGGGGGDKKKAEEQAANENSAIATDPKAVGDPKVDGISGGKVTLADFMGKEPSDEELAQAEQSATLEDSKSMADHASAISTGTARSEEDMLMAIAKGEYPRFIARVSPLGDFQRYGSFGNAGRPFIFATEPADLRGCKPAEAMYKVGWTREWIEKKIGEEIVVCIFDTQAAVPVTSAPAADGSTTTENKTVEQGKMEWPQLTQAALGSSRFIRDAKAQGIEETELKELFDICSKTPVKAEPRTSDPDKKQKCLILRELIDQNFGANALYTGMGATMQEDGGLGGREIMIKPNGTGFKLVPGNHTFVSLGKLTKEDVESLFRSSKP